VVTSEYSGRALNIPAICERFPCHGVGVSILSRGVHVVPAPVFAPPGIVLIDG
jgi:hypothetical protein